MPNQPNILLFITDDLCWGDLSCHGNPHTQTPHLDRLHDEGARLERYCSGPLCSPARASLMTGRYSYRTGVVDTYIGRSMMHHDEVTIAQMLKSAGYRTGAFGKWHLGDNYPMRACDKGFDDTVMHHGGGIGQPGDHEGSTYFDPICHKNGKPQHYDGYCTDVFTDEAIRFMTESVESNAAGDQPFFCFLATNAPHSPLDVEDKWADPFREKGLAEKYARLYGMNANIDWNVGRLVATLESLGVADDTIIMFTSDHGPCGSASDDGKPRFNCDLRGIKGSVYEGGIRVPCFLRWPNGFKAGHAIDRVANPIDILPTLLDAADVQPAADVEIDGDSFAPLLADEQSQDAWPGRTTFIQWHRGDVPQRYKNCAAITHQYKLVNGAELYDLLSDPLEKKNIADDKPDVVNELRQAYDAWFTDVSNDRGPYPDHYDPPRIVVGTPHESPSVLTRQDWRGPDREPTREGAEGIGWDDTDVGYWLIHLPEPARCNVTVRLPALDQPGVAFLRCGRVEMQANVATSHRACTFENVHLPQGDATLEAWITQPDGSRGARYVDVARVS